jgi:predicted oxidoreductase
MSIKCSGRIFNMKYLNIGNQLKASEISLGMMRISSMKLKEIEELTETALENGINFFDHADIYGGGKCEEMFAEAIGMNSDKREKFIIQTKCGIRSGFFDFFERAYFKFCRCEFKETKN